MSPAVLTRGRSDAADFVLGLANRERQHMHASHALGVDDAVYSELMTVWEECRRPNWDGLGAVAVTWETVETARRFLESLPLGMSPTSIGAEPDGDVTIEWYSSPRRTVSVSATADGELHYAGLFGPNRAYGTESFLDEAPAAIVSLIRRVFAI